MNLRRLLGAATAAALLGSLTAIPAATASPAEATQQSGTLPATLAPSAENTPEAMWKQTPDGFAALPGYGLAGTTAARPAVSSPRPPSRN